MAATAEATGRAADGSADGARDSAEGASADVARLTGGWETCTAYMCMCMFRFSRLVQQDFMSFSALCLALCLCEAASSSTEAASMFSAVGGGVRRLSVADVVDETHAFFLYLFETPGGLAIFVLGAGCLGFCGIPYIFKCWLTCFLGSERVYPGGGLGKAFGLV